MTADSLEAGALSAAPARPDEDDLKAEEDADAAYEVDDVVDTKPKKKRKLVKNSDKKYQCPQPECGKSYSRAEHLYRHQLNHTPKQIYHCDFPGCERHFVRADLCARHKERHTAKGSHLQRKDAFLSSQRSSGPSGGGPGTTSPTLPSNTSPVQPNHALPRPSFGESEMPAASARTLSDATDHYAMSELTPVQSGSGGMPVDPQLAYGAYPNNVSNGAHPAPPMGTPPSPSALHPAAYDGPFARPASQMHGFNPPPPSVGVTAMHPPPPISSPSASGPVFSQQPYPSPTSASQPFRSSTGYSHMPSLPPFAFPQGYGPPGSARSGSIMSPSTMTSADQHPAPNSRCNSITDFNVIDQMTSGYAMPVFGNDSFFRTSPPPLMDDTLMNALFSSNGLDLGTSSPTDPEPMPNLPAFNNPVLPKIEPDGTPHEPPPPPASDGAWKEAPAAADSPDINMRESLVSPTKRQRLADIINGWGEIEQNPGRRTKAEILKGDASDMHHVLSLHMLKSFMTSYWSHIHQQMPILHRPTFNSETCPDLLLLAMMCLGATCLEQGQPVGLMQNSAELAFFMAYHIRWEVFRDAEFRPTAKLWTFQTMLLLELFEKMYSTRTLHERAHIHHATTLTVMRRGSSLIGRSATDVPQSGNDPTRTPPGPDGSINTSGQNTPDAFWNRWITAEATRRVAFAAFIIDSTHATLFGHSAVMSPHDLKLPLPCDEALWSATSSAEVQRVEASLAANGFKPTTFLEGLKRTLNGQKVRTNTFGRVILMAGLLNVSWHMNQRDLQVSSLGVQNTLGTQIKWRSPLTRAFDFWKRDFDESLSKNEHWLQVCNPNATDRDSIGHRDHVFESRMCLHSLAHMAMHVDMIDCQVFAGADRVLGRIVTDADRTAVQRRMEQWAPSARARDATFYALRFLCEVLIPEEELSSQRLHSRQPPTFTYSAREDYLLNRPWILYFAVLIVWSYGYALDGPIQPPTNPLTTRELQIFDMQHYLIRMGGVASPDDLEKLKDRNACLGLVLLIRDCFKEPRWELLHDANDILNSCVELLLPKHSEPASKQGG